MDGFQSSSDSEFSRSDSMGSLGDLTMGVAGGSTSPVGSLGAADVIPVAMAVTETVHAWFQGSDLSKQKVKVFGSVQVSFPGSAIPLLTGAPESRPVPLAFRLVRAEKVHALIPNKQVRLLKEEFVRRE